MARPKSDDPTIAVPLRIRGSAVDWWQAEADRLKMKLPKLLQKVIEEKAMRGGGIIQSGAVNTRSLTPARERPNVSGRSDEVEPRLKGSKGKK